MKKPDFFIVGAPKCGTTSLCEYLDQHPDIYISKPKEPYFFCPDLKEVEMTLEQYLQLFQVSDKKICGEGSTWYLYSEAAAQKIKEFNPDAKIIIMLREPISLLHSLHNQRLFSLTENIEDFEQALNLNKQRDLTSIIQATKNTEKMYFYIDIVKFSKQIARYFNEFNHQNIKIIFFDDFVSNTSRVYQEILFFLGVEPNFKPNLVIYNQNVKISNLRLHRLIQKPPQALFDIAKMLTPSFLAPIKKKIGWKIIDSAKLLINQNKKRKPISESLDKKIRMILSQEFDDLSLLIKKDLSCWK